MLAVTRLRPLRAEWSEVVALFLEGSYNSAVAASRTHQHLAASTLRARTFIRLERFEKAVDELDLCTENDKNAVRGECASIRSLALSYLGRFDEARDAQRDARAYLFSVNATALEAELHVNEAKLSLFEGDSAGARRLAQRAIDTACSVAADVVAENDITSTSIVLADAGNLLAALDSADDLRTQAVDHLVAGVKQLFSSKVVDVGMRARLLANLSGSLEGINAELEHSSFRLVRDLYETMNWTDELSVERFHVVRELGLASALEGDHLSAFRQYKRAFNIAPYPQLRLQALLDRVFLGEELKQHLVAHADLLEAQELATTVDWSTVQERELGCLPTLAMLLAPINLDAARAVLRSYTDRRAKSMRTSSQFIDKRFHGELLMAMAAIANAESRPNDAERALEAAFEIFANLGITWRAAQAAIQLRRNANPRYDSYVRTEAERRPYSWLAAKLSA